MRSKLTMKLFGLLVLLSGFLFQTNTGATQPEKSSNMLSDSRTAELSNLPLPRGEGLGEGEIVTPTPPPPSRGRSKRVTAKVPGTDEMSIYAFAENLYSEKDYYRAITEYKRLSFLYPQSVLIPQAKFRIAKSYQLGEKFQIAFDMFDTLAKEYAAIDIGQLSEFESTETLYRMGNYDLALSGYDKFITDSKYANLKDRAIYKQGYANLRLRDTQKAKQSFDMIRQASFFAGAAGEMTGKAEEFEKIKRKKPLLAGLMSAVIPGTGQFYNGRIKDGIIALITNGLFIWGTYEAFHREYYSIGAVAGTFALGWYSGNIFSAVNGSFRYNHNKEENFLEGLSQSYEFLGEK